MVRCVAEPLIPFANPRPSGTCPSPETRRPHKPNTCRACDFQLRGQDLNLRPSGYEAPEQGLQAATGRINPSESLDSVSTDSVPRMQAGSAEHKDFGQPVVS